MVIRSDGLAWSIRGKRELKISASGTLLSSMVLRTPLRPSGELRMDFRRSMASVLWEEREDHLCASSAKGRWPDLGQRGGDVAAAIRDAQRPPAPHSSCTKKKWKFREKQVATSLAGGSKGTALRPRPDSHCGPVSAPELSCSCP